jgi:hypothetical protein
MKTFRKMYFGLPVVFFVNGTGVIVVRFDYERMTKRYPLKYLTLESTVHKYKQQLVGKAKCHPEDNYNEKIGMHLAMLRLLRCLQKLILEQDKRMVAGLDKEVDTLHKYINYRCAKLEADRRKREAEEKTEREKMPRVYAKP